MTEMMIGQNLNQFAACHFTKDRTASAVQWRVVVMVP